MFKAIGTILAIPDLRQRIFFTLIALAIYRIGFFIYLPGVDVNLINSMTESQNESSGLLSFISMTSLLTGGALSQATIFSLGIMPYISASIIFSLMTKVFPKLEELQKEGESGRKVIARWTRYSAVGLCLIQSMFVGDAPSTEQLSPSLLARTSAPARGRGHLAFATSGDLIIGVETEGGMDAARALVRQSLGRGEYLGGAADADHAAGCAGHAPFPSPLPH